MFVVDRPRGLDDSKNVLCNDEEKDNKPFRTLLESLKKNGGGLQWVLTSAVRCGNASYTVPVEEQKELCRVNFLNPTIADLKPQIIVAMGQEAWRAVLGLPESKKPPRMLFPVKTPDGIWVLPSWEANKLSKSRMATLVKWINGIRSGTYDDVEFTYKRIHSRNEALAVAKTLPYEVVFDVETEQSDYSPSKLTMWGRDTNMFMFSTCHKEGDGKYVTYVYENQAVCSEVLHEIAYKRFLIAHNFKYDLNATYRFFNLKLETIVSGWLDTLLFYWLGDQSIIRKGLKDLTEEFFFVPDYSKPIKDNLAFVNAEHNAEENARITLENKKRSDLRKKNLGLLALDIKTSDKKLNYEDDETISTQVLEIMFDRLRLSDVERQELAPLFPATPKLGYSYVDRGLMAEYCAKDTFYTARLYYERLLTRPEAEQPTDQIMKHAKKWTELLANIERVGIPIDLEQVAKLRHLLQRKVNGILSFLIDSPIVQEALVEYHPKVREIIRKYKYPKKGKAPHVNGVWQKIAEFVKPNSPQLCLAIINKWNPDAYAWLEPTDSKESYSVDETALERLAKLEFSNEYEYGHNADAPRTEIEYVWYNIYWFRKHRKTLDEFLKKFVAYRGVDNFIHTTYSIHTAITGRTNSREPNLQNVKKDWAVRSCFKAFPGYVFCECDYDRMEPTTLSVLADIPAWKKIFENNWDLYCIVANQVFKDVLENKGLWIDLESVEDSEVKTLLDRLKKKEPELRDTAKVSTLAIIYGEEPNSFAARTGRPLNEVKLFYDRFFKAYPEIKRYIDSQRALLKEGAYISNPFGRKRWFKLTGEGKTDRSLANQIINFPNQATASDIALDQGCRLLDWLKAQYPDVYLINIVHDAFYLLVPSNLVEEVMPKVQSLLSDMSPFEWWDPKVPVRTSFKQGKTWGEML